MLWSCMMYVLCRCFMIAESYEHATSWRDHVGRSLTPAGPTLIPFLTCIRTSRMYHAISTSRTLSYTTNKPFIMYTTAATQGMVLRLNWASVSMDEPYRMKSMFKLTRSIVSHAWFDCGLDTFVSNVVWLISVRITHSCVKCEQTNTMRRAA